MKHLKKFEAFDYSNERELIEKIRDTVESLAYDFESFDDFNPNDYPEIRTELALISYKKEIEDIYDVVEPTDMSLEEFTILYNKISEEAEQKLIKYLKENPFKSIDNITGIFDIPQWIIDYNKNMIKFNI
jgi:hypothetical protein